MSKQAPSRAALHHARNRRRSRAIAGGSSAVTPVIVERSPNRDATDVAVTATLSIAFNTPIRLNTGSIVLRNLTSGSDAEVFDVGLGSGSNGGTITASTFIVAITPGTGLSPQTDYAVLIDASAIESAAGELSFAGISNSGDWSFSTQALSQPAIIGSAPVDNETGVLLSSNIVVTFNENLVAETGNVTLRRLDGPSVVETFDVSNGSGSAGGSVSLLDNTVTVDPAAVFEAGIAYALRIDATCYRGLTSGQLFAGISNDTLLNFTAAVTPLLESSVPGDDDVGIAVDTSIVLIFDQPVQSGTGSIVLRDLGGPSIVESFDVATGLGTAGGSVGFAGATVTVAPGANLSANSSYAVQVGATAVQSLAGPAFAGIADDTTLNFTTVTASAPVVLSSTPGVGAGAIAVDTDISVRFSTNVQPGTGNFTLKIVGGATVESFDVQSGIGSAGGTLTIVNDAVTLNPNDDLANSANYAIQIDATAIDSLAGLSFAGISNDTELNFLTVEAVPQIIGSDPADNSTDHPVADNIVLTFDNNMEANPSAGLITLKLVGGATVETFNPVTLAGSTGGSMIISGPSVTLNPNVDLTANTAYAVQIAPDSLRTALDDVAFPGISNDADQNFTTAAAGGGAWDPVVDGNAVWGIDAEMQGLTSATDVIAIDQVGSRD